MNPPGNPPPPPPGDRRSVPPPLPGTAPPSPLPPPIPPPLTSAASGSGSGPPGLLRPPVTPRGNPFADLARPSAGELRTRLAPPLPPVGKPARSPLLLPDELDRFGDLLVFARSTVEGFFSGKHKSPYRGYSAEFADYKEYVPGDALQHVDWRVYGRTRRLFVRQYEEETDMVVYLLVDASRSMAYAGEKRPPKFFIAARIAAALSYLMLNQGDKAAMGLFADEIITFVPPGGTRRHLHRIVTELEKATPASTTGFAATLAACGPLFRKRGRLVILSDFLADRRELFDALGRFVHRGFEILLLQLVDPDERQLPGVGVARFVDLETGAEVEVEPAEIRAEYMAATERELAELAREADQLRIEHAIVDTRRPYVDALETFLGLRGAGVRRT